ncbi:uncharacterized protein LOC143956299 [Lithobates pipiens]
MDRHVKKGFRFKDKIIRRCRLTCRRVGHYHCHFCKRTIIRRMDMERHLPLCQIAVMLKPPPTAPSPVLIPPPVVSSPVLIPPPVVSSPVLIPPPPESSPVLIPPPAASSPVLIPPPAASSPVLIPPPAASSPVLIPPPAASSPVLIPPPAASSPVLIPPPAASSPVLIPPPAASTPVLIPPLAASSTVPIPLSTTPSPVAISPPAASSPVQIPPPTAPSPMLIPPPAAPSSVANPQSSTSVVEHTYALPPAPATATELAEFVNCPQCSHRLLSKNLKAHMLRKHSDVHKLIRRCRQPCRPVGHYHCHLCKRTIIRRMDMERHLFLCEVSAVSKPPPAASSPVPILPPAASSPVPIPPPAASSPVPILPPAASSPVPILPPAASSPVLIPPPAASSLVSSPQSSKSGATARVIVICPECSLCLLKKNLKTHMLRKHAYVPQDITLACNLRNVNVDETNGIFAAQRTKHGLSEPLHEQRKNWGKDAEIKSTISAVG